MRVILWLTILLLPVMNVIDSLKRTDYPVKAKILMCCLGNVGMRTFTEEERVFDRSIIERRKYIRAFFSYFFFNFLTYANNAMHGAVVTIM